MKWQHWLDPVGQYTSLIVAVKSQFVFGTHIVGFSSTGNPACAPSCYLSAVAVRGSYGALGGFGSGDSRTRGRLGRFSQASTRARCVVLLAQAKAYATQKNVRARGPSNGNRAALLRWHRR